MSIKLSQAKKLLENCGYTITRNVEYDTYRLPIDYTDMQEFSIRRCGDVLTESLYYYNPEKFIKQMKLVIPDFTNYVYKQSHNDLLLHLTILDKFKSQKDFEDLLDKYCFRLRKITMLYVVIGPEYNLSNRNEDYYVHLSPINNLQEIGIEPRSSNRFEKYTPRIYLFKLSELVDYDNTMENIAEDLYYSCRSIVKLFNETYSENKTYYVYLCKLPEEIDVFQDNVFEKMNACYIFDKIVPSRIKRITII